MSAPPTRIDPERLRAALSAAREALDDAARRSGRGPGAVELVLAGKYVPVAQTDALIAAGVGTVGENRLQDLQARQERAAGRLTFDFIGHVQRRKARDVLPAVRLIHSVDSLPLALELARRMPLGRGPARVLVQVNVAEEDSKGGIVPRQLPALVREISARTELVIGGLMAMPPAQPSAERSRPHFAAVRTAAEALRAEWAGRHDLHDLSMGTSQDYLVAAEEGATLVRVGRGIIDEAAVPAAAGG